MAWCQSCKQDRMMTVTGRDCQLAWCTACAEEISVAQGDGTGGSLQISKRSINRLVEDGKLYLIETVEGFILTLRRPASQTVS